ncbi:glycosyltransferase, partial [Acinetobacter baumannii]
ARKAILTTDDSGGVLELVNHEQNGLICPPDAVALAEAMDRLFLDRAYAARLGRAAEARIGELNITWANVVEKFLS